MSTLSLKPQKVYLAAGYTDLRMGIDGLGSIIRYQFRLDPQTPCLFLFCGRRADRIKGLFWQGDGFLLLYKRLDNGRFHWPRSQKELKELSPQQLRWLLDGLSIGQKTSIHPVKPLQKDEVEIDETKTEKM